MKSTGSQPDHHHHDHAPEPPAEHAAHADRAHAVALKTFADHVVVTWVAGEVAYERPASTAVTPGQASASVASSTKAGSSSRSP